MFRIVAILVSGVPIFRVSTVHNHQRCLMITSGEGGGGGGGGSNYSRQLQLEKNIFCKSSKKPKNQMKTGLVC